MRRISRSKESNCQLCIQFNPMIIFYPPIEQTTYQTKNYTHNRRIQVQLKVSVMSKRSIYSTLVKGSKITYHSQMLANRAKGRSKGRIEKFIAMKSIVTKDEKSFLSYIKCCTKSNTEKESRHNSGKKN